MTERDAEDVRGLIFMGKVLEHRTWSVWTPELNISLIMVLDKKNLEKRKLIARDCNLDN